MGRPALDELHLFAAVPRRIRFLPLYLGHRETHPTHSAVEADGNFDEIGLIRLGGNGTSQQPHHPDPKPEDGGAHGQGYEQIQRRYILSMMRALAMPPPSHIVWSP